MIKRLLLLLIIFALSLTVKAQGPPTLKVTTITVNGIANFPDTIYGGVFYSYIITIRNLDSTITYVSDSTEAFTINMRTDSSLIGAFTIYSDSAQIVILPGDSFSLQYSDTFPSGGFKIGNNVVVVWPSINTLLPSLIADSSYFTIYFPGILGIPDFDKLNLLVYPNPFIDLLSFSNTYDNHQLYIYDEAGRLVYQNPFDKKSYDLSFLKQGLYLVELRKSNIVVARRKMIKR
ncbi:MAG: T9SS type A sorting domain-containing protein [Bacteroidia bacterium]